MTTQEKVINVAEKILANKPKGLPFRKLYDALAKELKQEIESGEIPQSTIWGYASRLHFIAPGKFSKENWFGAPFMLKGFRKSVASKSEKQRPKRAEADFYDSIKKYLLFGESDEHPPECTHAAVLGGRMGVGLWKTPDVVGVMRPSQYSGFNFEHEIIVAEIKIQDKPDAYITGFGQVCAYRLSSHKQFLVIPKTVQDARLESLCRVFGIGLIYFDDSAEPDIGIYELRLPPQKCAPNLFYTTQFINEIRDRKPEVFKMLYPA